MDSVDPSEISNFYRRADIVLGRSGANTVAEVVYTRRPAVFIPIPWSLMDEQRKNAQYAKDLGLAEIVDQDASSAELIRALDRVRRNWNTMVKRGNDNDKHSAELVVETIEGLL